MSVYRIARAALIVCCFAVGSTWASSGLFSSGPEPEFLDPVDVFTVTQVPQQEDEYLVQRHIADNYYVYRHSLKLVDGHDNDVNLVLPSGTLTHDEFFGDTEIVRPDMTRNDSTDKELLKHWGVMGPPTLILVGPDGTERRDLRVVGEINANNFLERLNMAGVS